MRCISRNSFAPSFKL